MRGRFGPLVGDWGALFSVSVKWNDLDAFQSRFQFARLGRLKAGLHTLYTCA